MAALEKAFVMWLLTAFVVPSVQSRHCSSDQYFIISIKYVVCLSKLHCNGVFWGDFMECLKGYVLLTCNFPNRA